MLSFLIFDNRLTNYDVKLIAQERFRSIDDIGPYAVASFSFQYLINIHSLEKVIKGRGSIIIEFVYFEKGQPWPKSHFYVVREDAWGSLCYYNHFYDKIMKFPIMGKVEAKR